ncbi:cytochrome P450 4d8-like isoform X1 [Zeugodacus cucurbitae]|uniref:cytochrome P450 4d8-like isoform X1 n=1 Tax=Zeugodacus cucurbitae TaxID=28588 RepID=UPI0023D954BE|nr:cytochrome P450 4d8-like isoform X1 [Zeugodacus cucurbitae]
MFFFAILLLFFTLVLLNYVSMFRIRCGALHNIPGPYCYPFVGAVQVFLQLRPDNLLEYVSKMHERYGSMVTAWVANRISVSSIDLELNEQILVSQQHIVKHLNYKMLRQWLGTGLLLSDGRKWFARRKIITPAFHFKILEQFVEVFEQQSTILLRCLAKKADGCTAFDVYPFVCLAALDIIAETAMGTKVGAQTNERTEYALAVNKTTKLFAYRFTKVHLDNENLFSIFCPHLKWQQMRLIKTLHEFTTNVIKQRREALENNRNVQKVDEDSSGDSQIVGSKKRMALLDMLLQSTIGDQPLSDEDIREEVDTFMFEGHDTTTSAISFTLHLLSRHLEVQQKVLQEVAVVLGDDREQPISLRELNELKYTECVIKETLRLYPSVPIVGRQLTKDFKYTHSQIGDGVIPAGTEVLIVLFGMLRQARYFERPDDFVPERHLNNECASAFLFIPFSAGPRNCIGQKFAMLEMKMIIAKIVREYELLPFGEPVQPEINIVMRSATGFQLGMRKRD